MEICCQYFVEVMFYNRRTRGYWTRQSHGPRGLCSTSVKGTVLSGQDQVLHKETARTGLCIPQTCTGVHLFNWRHTAAINLSIRHHIIISRQFNSCGLYLSPRLLKVVFLSIHLSSIYVYILKGSTISAHPETFELSQIDLLGPYDPKILRMYI